MVAGYFFAGDSMNKNFKLISVLLSIIISIALVFTSAATVLLSATRDYYTSSMFDTQIENTDLATLKFIYNGEKITLEDYVKNYVNTNVDEIILDKAGQYYSDLWFPFADALTDYTVDKAFSSDYVNTLVKDEFKDIIDYFLYSNVDEAKERIKNKVSLEDNYQLNPENTGKYEEKIKAQVKLAVLQYVEEVTGITCDEIIVLFAEKTVSAFKMISIALGILLLVLNVKNIINVLLYSGVVLCGFGSEITYVRNSFEEHFTGMQDIITYELLKPVVDGYTQYAGNGITFGIICFILFAVLTVIICIKKKSK